ncbi:YhdP family protein [Pseudoduganella danionis]|uniref:TIGR02099 family protein n=1 Tax=Pseudoduganella danionis TaxID=1890295 RepID=A0ABW9SLU2_9BURK|nr:YhdP family protein [Pseudoduganella danionis]MTW33123.1 TIGR02099 family protein [Pseudoduganella danionis]
MQKRDDQNVSATPPGQPDGEGYIATRWHRLTAFYRFCNLASHHVLGFTVKLALLLYFAFAILFLTLRYAVLPNIDHYKGDIERLASRAVGNAVSIDRVYASWHGLRPNLFLGDVVLHDSAGRPALSLPSVSATLSWWSAVSASVRFESLELVRPDLSVLRDAQGRLYVAGMLLDLNKPSDGKGADWLLAQREIVIREGRVQWLDQQRQAPLLALDGVHVVLRNQWLRHQLAVRATPPAALAAPLDVRADFSHPAFGARVSNLSMWKGELYADIRNTDLLTWKPWLDFPFELHSGGGSLRAWLGIDQSRLTGFTADLGLQNVSAVLGKELPVLDLRQLSGRIAAREELPNVLPLVVKGAKGAGSVPFGALGHAVELSQLSLTTSDGFVMAPTSLSERYVAASGPKPEQTTISAAQLDLQSMAGLAERLPLSEHQRQLLADFAPRGLLKNFSAEWRGAYPALQAYRIKGDLVGLGLKPQPPRPGQAKTARTPAIAAMPAIPGFENLSGAIDATEKGGSFSLNSQQLVLHMPDYFSSPSMPFEHLNLKARWSFERDEMLLFQIDSMDFLQQGMSGTLQGSHRMPLAGKGLGTVDFSGTLNNFQINRIDSYLPIQTPHDLRAWLTGALEGGVASDVNLRLRGDLAHFPFHGETGAERNRGEFRVAGKLTEGKLNYAPGQYLHDGKDLGKDGKPLPLWPQAEHIKGSFVFDRARMEIRGDTATTGGVALSGVKAVVANLDAHNALLEIDGNAAGPMQEFLKYVASSPVLEWISNFTDETQASGNAKLALKLQLPLAHLIDAQVQGSLQLQNNEITLMNELPPVQAAQGKIEFNERGVNLNQLSGNFLGGPVSITGGSQRDNAIVVKLAGTLTADGFRKQYGSPAMQRLASHFAGATRYTGTVTARDHQVTVAVDSSLNGLTVDLPVPLRKVASEAMPLRFVLNSALTPDSSGSLHDDIRISLGGNMAARYQRAKTGKQAWKLVRGGIGIATPAPEPESGLAYHVNLRALNVDAWLDFANSIGGKDGGASAASDSADLLQYVMPDTIAARSNELIIGDRKLENVVLGVGRQKTVWQANIDSTQANGYLTWSEPSTGQGLGKVTARLSSLVIPESASKDVQELLDSQAASTTIPALDIVVERFELFNKALGRLELQANNAQLAAQHEWRVSKLLLSNADGEFKGSGLWVSKDGAHDSSLIFDLDIANAGKLLDRFGFAGTLKGGKGNLSGEIGWKGLPYALDWPSLSGQIKLNVEKGQFLKQDPGAAKLLGVLSLQALPRLLKLDFHDVFSEGLAFDGITASAGISHGIVRTDNLKMHGVAATVLMDGSADLANETTNLHVVVIPEVNLGTAPLVYALAVNPVIGLGSFLAQLFLSAPVMKALTYHMQVTGPWKAPVVTKIETAKTEVPPPPKGAP